MEVTHDGLWMVGFLEELVPCVDGKQSPIKLYEDNKGAIDLALGCNLLSCSVHHVTMHVAFLHEHNDEHNLVHLEYVCLEDNLAAVLTKPVPLTLCWLAQERFGLLPCPISLDATC